MFVFKKLAALVTLPFEAAFGLVATGLALLLPFVLAGRLRRLARPGAALAVAGVGLLFLFSWPPVQATLSRSLEEPYRVLAPAALPADLGAVVVLGGGVLARTDLTTAERLGVSTLRRTLEGVRLWRARPEARLIFSSGAWRDDAPAEAPLMAEFAASLGVPRAAMVIEERSRDTYENMMEVAKLLPPGPWALVTSARHLPRSLAVAAKLGLSPIPAPCDFGHDPDRPWRFWPSLGALQMNQSNAYEYLGRLWYWLQGRL